MRFVPPKLSRIASRSITFLPLVLICVSLYGQDRSGQVGLVKTMPPEGRSVKVEGGFMVPYTSTIPGSKIKFEMVPIPGGEFLMGSPKSEADREASEGPQFKVKVEPFWMGKYEITWSEYKTFMELHDVFKDFESYKMRPVTEKNQADAISAPSNLYDPSFTFESGEEPRQPAVTMAQYAAKQYTKWLSSVSTQFYRLPGEAEWEYACRAGTTTAFSFGDDPKQLGDHAWYYDNADDKTQLVGQKKPNPWGLHDMHGNVAEWVLDEFKEDHYAAFKGGVTSSGDALAWPVKLFPRVVRGGSWELDPEQCRSASRMKSHDDEWRAEDPNFPQSPWWFTSSPATGIGFRIIRPLHAPKSKEAKEKYWKADLEQIARDVKFRISQEGRGAFGIVDPSLPKAIEELKQVKKQKRNK